MHVCQCSAKNIIRVIKFISNNTHTPPQKNMKINKNKKHKQKPNNRLL